MLVEQTAAEKNLVFLYEDKKLSQDERACEWLAGVLSLKGFKAFQAYASEPWDYTDMEAGQRFPKACLTSSKKFLEELKQSEYLCCRIHGEYNGQKVVIGIDLKSYRAFIVRSLAGTGIQEDLAEALRI